MEPLHDCHNTVAEVEYNLYSHYVHVYHMVYRASHSLLLGAKAKIFNLSAEAALSNPFSQSSSVALSTSRPSSDSNPHSIKLTKLVLSFRSSMYCPLTVIFFRMITPYGRETSLRMPPMK